MQPRKTAGRRSPRRLKALLESAAYREADRDVEFLNDDATRGLRLQLEYLKTESVLRRQRIGHTILVLGSTHICEPAAARRRAEHLRRAPAGTPPPTGSLWR